MLSYSIVLLLMTCMYKRARTDECSKIGLFPGIAKDRGVLYMGRILQLNIEVPSTCDAGVACANACSEDSAEWNFIEFRRVSMHLLYLIFQETGRGIICMCFISLTTPSIQTSWLMYHGFIFEGALVNNGKHISLMTLVNPSSPVGNYYFYFCLRYHFLFICTIDVSLHRFIYIYANDTFV